MTEKRATIGPPLGCVLARKRAQLKAQREGRPLPEEPKNRAWRGSVNSYEEVDPRG